MDINNNQQVNTFIKGMNTDVSDALMDSSQYRYAENVRLVTNTDSNSGEVRLVDGTKLFMNFFEGINIKTICSIRNLLVVIGDNDYIYTLDTNASNLEWKVKFIPNEGESFGQYLSVVTRYENPQLIKLYIADGIHSILYINLANDDIVYGIKNIQSEVEVLLNQIKTSISSTSGTIKPCKVQYAYRVYKLGGAATSLSMLSSPLTIYKNEGEGYRPDEKQSNKAVELKLPKMPEDLDLNMMQIYRISYIQIGQQPEVSLIYDGNIMENKNWIDTGYDIQQISLAELISQIKLDIRPTVIESKNDYLFAANVKYIQSELDSTWSSDIMRTYSSGDYQNGIRIDYNLQFKDDAIYTYDQKYWKKKDGSIGGDGKYLSWKYIIKPIYVDFDNIRYEYNTSTKTKGNKISGQQASLRQGEVYRYGAILHTADGKTSSVRWVADIMAPTGYYPELAEDGGGYIVQQIGIQFEIPKNLEGHVTLPSNCVAIEIVRCQRTVADRISLTQGIAGFPFRVWSRGNKDSDREMSEIICPTSILSTTRFFATGEFSEDDGNRNASVAITDPNYLMFASPEYAYQPDDIKNLLNDNKNNINVQFLYNNSIDTEEIPNADKQNVVNDISVWIGTNVDIVDELRTNRYFRIKSTDTAADKSAYFMNKVAGDADHGSLMEGQVWSTEGTLKNTWVYTESTALVNYTGSNGRNSKMLEEEEGFPTISIYHTYPKPINDNQYVFSEVGNNVDIFKVAYPAVPDYNKLFKDNGELSWNNDITSVDGGTQYNAWSVPLLNKTTSAGSFMKDTSYDGFDGSNIGQHHFAFYPIGTTGKCMVMKLSNAANVPVGEMGQLTVPVLNIRKLAVPYGGQTTTKTSSYISFGNVIYPSDDNNTINVYDGDCYPGIFTYNASHAWHSPNTRYGIRSVGIYSIALESDIDLSGTSGDLYTRVQHSRKYYIQDQASSISDKYTQIKDAYLYNTAYGSMPNAVTHTSVEYTDIDTEKYDTRVHNSELKTNGEHIDSWLTFKSNNFLDVDSRFGQITNMKLFKDSLLYWQDRATGILSVNERSIVTDMDDNKIILGTAGILSRYDYISTVHGMKQYQYQAETQSNTTQYWWDGYNKEILAYAGGQQLASLVKMKQCTNYVNQYNEMNDPCLSYDTKYNELISSVVNCGSIVYNEQVGQFTSIYTFNPVRKTKINDRLYLSDAHDIYTWNNDANNSILFNTAAYPLIKYVTNSQSQYVKVFDIATFGGRFYGGNKDGLNNITFTFNTPLKQKSRGKGSSLITNREYDFRLDIPRNANSSYGDRMRGKTMQCELKSSSNSTDFSLQYIITKYRMSWS